MMCFGPVPSRRLGRSLGINNIPHKICTYSCVYCHVGRTLKCRLEPSAFYEPEVIAREVVGKIDAVTEMTWRRINRPHTGLKMEGILEGILEFRKDYSGTLVTETMLIRGLLDQDLIVDTEYEGQTFFIRKFPKSKVHT